MAFRYVRRLLHWGPLLAMTVIGVISTCTILCDLQWWPLTTAAGVINMVVFLTWNVLTFYNLFTAAFVGPGHVPSAWKPKKKSDQLYLQYCQICESYKAPRSHHCRKCKSCVMKMDHHCPWINNCVGHRNHASFTGFLFFAPCGCIHALCILIPSMYRALNRSYYIKHGTGVEPLVWMTFNTFFSCMIAAACAVGVTIALFCLLAVQNYYMYYGTGDEPIIFMGIHTFICCMFAVGLAIGVVIAVGGLLYIQVRSILKNETGIESWIIDKAGYRDRTEEEGEFVYPYNLGWRKNLANVIYWSPRPDLDGVRWPVTDGCDQYTLTKEQIKQKMEKRERSVAYSIHEKYGGYICPCNKGCGVFWSPPFTDEPRIALTPGDTVLVTRWKKHWLYGDKLQPDSDKTSRTRGWFPRRCACEIVPECEHKPEANDHQQEQDNNHTTHNKKDD